MKENGLPFLGENNLIGDQSRSQSPVPVSPIIDSVVEKGAAVCTDEWKSYRTLGENYDHSFIKHSANQYVDGSVHTNNIENFWSLLKRDIDGIYRHVSDKHLARYVNE